MPLLFVKNKKKIVLVCVKTKMDENVDQHLDGLTISRLRKKYTKSNEYIYINCAFSRTNPRKTKQAFRWINTFLKVHSIYWKCISEQQIFKIVPLTRHCTPCHSNSESLAIPGIFRDRECVHNLQTGTSNSGSD